MQASRTSWPEWCAASPSQQAVREDHVVASDTCRSFDRTANRWSVLILLAFCSTVLIAIALGLTVEESNRFGAIVCLSAAAALAVYAVAYFRQRLVADSEGIRVRNLFSRFSLSWSEIDHFEHPAAQFSAETFRGHYGLRIVMADGQVRFASLWGAARINMPGFAQPVVDELNRRKSQG